VKTELSNQEVSPEGKKNMMDILQRMNDDEYIDSDDSDDEEDQLELADRLNGIDLDDTNLVWEKLTKSEKEQFDNLIKSGDLASVLPDYKPWWTIKIAVPKITEIDAPADDSYKLNCPSLQSNIVQFDTICKAPSPYLKFGLMNIIYAYAYAVKYFNGDYQDEVCEFVEIVQLLAKNLSGQNFELADTAIESAASEVNNHQFMAISLEFSRNVKKDVVDILKGPSGSDSYYIMSALSDLILQFKKALKLLKKSGFSSEKEQSTGCNLPIWLRTVQRKPDLNKELVSKHLRKIEFYLSWSVDHYDIMMT